MLSLLDIFEHVAYVPVHEQYPCPCEHLRTDRVKYSTRHILLWAFAPVYGLDSGKQWSHDV